jgi:hypothetical protein
MEAAEKPPLTSNCALIIGDTYEISIASSYRVDAHLYTGGQSVRPDRNFCRDQHYKQIHPACPTFGVDQDLRAAWDIRANTAGNFSLVYGITAATPGDTGTVAITGTYNFAAQSGLSRDGGVQPLYVIPSGNALCAVTSGAPVGASISLAGSLSFTQY